VTGVAPLSTETGQLQNPTFPVQVAIVDGNVQLAIDGKVVKTHPIRHDPIKEHGAFANPGGRPPKKRSA
jgi:hypothetical protein